MTLTAKRVFPLLTLPAIAFVMGGCLVGVPGYRETPVYGDYGYVGPWYGGQIEVEGGDFVRPPYGRSDGDRRDDDSRRRERAAPERTYGRSDRDRRDDDSRRREKVAPERIAPAQRPAPRPIPSIPNNPRPERRRGGNDKHQR
jgi:hypothetical protein